MGIHEMFASGWDVHVGKTRNKMKQKPYPQTYKSSAQAPSVFSVFSLVLMLAPSLGSVSEVRLMFFGYFLLWQLLSCVVLDGHLALC